MIAGGIQTDAPGYVHLNVEEAVTLSTDPAYMGVLILTLSPLTALVGILPPPPPPKKSFSRNMVIMLS